MSIQDWGAVGEIVGAIAVVLTLIYLSLQIRQSSITQRAQTHQQLTGDRAQALLTMMGNKDAASAVRKASTGQELNEDERWILFWFTILNLRAYENEIYQHSLGMIDDSELENQRKLLELPAMQLDLVQQMSLHTFTPRVQEDVRAILAQRGKNA